MVNKLRPVVVKARYPKPVVIQARCPECEKEWTVIMLHGLDYIEQGDACVEGHDVAMTRETELDGIMVVWDEMSEP